MKQLFSIYSALCCLLLLLASCAPTTLRHDEEYSRKNQWAKATSPFACMSLLAYRKHQVKMSNKTQFVPARNPAQLPTSESDLAQYCCDLLKSNHWKMIHARSLKQQKKDGLYYQIWLNQHTDHPTLVFAFEGTNSGKDDWYSNLRWFSPRRESMPDQYRLIHHECIPLLHQLLEKLPSNTRVASTGHSLGGGLAQHLFYSAIDHMDQAIVFNTSPVTGFRDLSEAQRKKFKQQIYREEFPIHRIIRVHEKGEILEYARNFTQQFFRQDSLIATLEFENPDRGNAIKKHGMARMTYQILHTELWTDGKIRSGEVKPSIAAIF